MKIERIVTGNLEENCYLLVKNNKCLIIDPGDDFSIIENKIGNLSLIGVLLTHHRFDHVGALNEVVYKYEVEVYDSHNLLEGKKNIDCFSFEVIYTKGHTSDSISFYFEQEKVMFTGDFLFKNNIGRTDLLTGNIDDMKNSINRIKQYKEDIIVYPGHGEMTTIKDEKNNNYYLFTNW